MQSTSSTQKLMLRISGTSRQSNRNINTSNYAPEYSVKHTDISCNELPRVGTLLKRPGSFFLRATIAGITRRTYIVERSSSPSWEDPLSFDLEGGGLLTIQVVDQHRPGKPKLIGELLSPIEISGDFQGEKRYPEQRLVHREKKKTEDAGSVSFTLTRLSYPDASESVRAQTQLAGASAGKMEAAAKVEGIMGGLSEVDKPIEKAENFAKSWKPLLDKIGLLITMGDAISGIDPYAKMAWSILSPALKAVEEQKERDERILGLLDTINNSYDFVDTTKPLRTEDLGSARKEIIKKMLQQTYDCAWFIRDYTSRGFFGRAVDGMTGNHDSIVQQYIKSFNELKERFESKSLVGIEITVHRTLVAAQETRDGQILDDMAFARDQTLSKECLPQTRTEILAEITEWINHSSPSPSPSTDEPDQCVYWLYGVAGCGKSAIASTIAQRFVSMKRCVWYFFDASRQKESGPSQMFSRLSRGLADIDAKWKESLVGIANTSRQLRTTPNVRDQFENFILKPAAEFKPVGPILIVIDALDESGSREGRASLLQMLARLDELNIHGRFRFLIT